MQELEEDPELRSGIKLYKGTILLVLLHECLNPCLVDLCQPLAHHPVWRIRMMKARICPRYPPYRPSFLFIQISALLLLETLPKNNNYNSTPPAWRG